VGLLVSSQGEIQGSCTGTIVRDDLVLTAAHCVSAHGIDEVVIYDNHKGDVALRKVSKTFVVFPGYDTDAKSNNGALATLGKDLAFAVFGKGTFNSYAKAKIAAASAKPGDQVHLVGYGDTGFKDNSSNPQLKRFYGSNKVEAVQHNFGDALMLATTVVGMTTAGLGQGDSGGPLFNANGEVVGVAKANAMDVLPDGTNTPNEVINDKNPLRSIYVNVASAGVAPFINAVMVESAPTSATGQTVKVSDGPATGSQGGVAANGKPYCKNNGGEGYGMAFDCGAGSGLVCKKDDGSSFADSSICVVRGRGSVPSAEPDPRVAEGDYLKCPDNKFCKDGFGWLTQGEQGCTTAVKGFKENGCSCRC
jgi:V8-like Glu-specific endopeptidase